MRQYSTFMPQNSNNNLRLGAFLLCRWHKGNIFTVWKGDNITLKAVSLLSIGHKRCIITVYGAQRLVLLLFERVRAPLLCEVQKVTIYIVEHKEGTFTVWCINIWAPLQYRGHFCATLFVGINYSFDTIFSEL